MANEGNNIELSDEKVIIAYINHKKKNVKGLPKACVDYCGIQIGKDYYLIELKNNMFRKTEKEVKVTKRNSLNGRWSSVKSPEEINNIIKAFNYNASDEDKEKVGYLIKALEIPNKRERAQALNRLIKGFEVDQI